MKKIGTFIIFVILLLFAFGYYYITLPAINIHSPGLWTFMLGIVVILFFAYMLRKRKNASTAVMKGFTWIFFCIIVVFVIGSVLSSPIVNAKKYQALITIEDRDFNEDIKEVSYNEIPVLDKASAEKLGDRKMGTLIDMVSQFEVSNEYTQINYKQKPTRVTPLEYSSFIKWITNRKNGLPAYISIDMTSQEVTVNRLEKGMKYSFSEPFNRNVARYLRFNYPTYIFDNYYFEIDDNGVPYYVCPVRDYTIGLFGGVKISKVVLLNAVDGSLQEYDIDEVPQWIDKVYSADLLISYYDYYGMLKNGWLNSVLSQKGCLRTTEGYNYLALDDDVWVYTGITSIVGDQSNVGFVLMNQRTAQTRYYSIPGAEEYSAMASAEGQVQHLGYVATFPLLLNIGNEPTYFIALKDAAGLVKSYAMVNIEQYQIVAIGSNVYECEQNYINLLKTSGLAETEIKEKNEITGTITKITEAVIEGNSHHYIFLDNKEEIYDVDLSQNIDIIRYNIGDKITFDYEQAYVNKVTRIK